LGVLIKAFNFKDGALKVYEVPVASFVFNKGGRGGAKVFDPPEWGKKKVKPLKIIFYFYYLLTAYMFCRFIKHNIRNCFRFLNDLQ